MELLLNDRLAPITSEIGFLEAGINDVVSAYIQWMGSLKQPRGVTLVQSTLVGDLQSVLLNLATIH